MNHLITALFLCFAIASSPACATGSDQGSEPEKKPVIQPDCNACVEFVSQGQHIVDSQLKATEKSFDPEDYPRMQKQSKVRRQIVDHVWNFLEKNPISDPGVMDAVFDVWMLVVDYERMSEVAESNFKYFQPVLDKMYVRLAQRVASAKTDDEKRRLNLIKSGLAGTEGAEKGEAADGP